MQSGMEPGPSRHKTLFSLSNQIPTARYIISCGLQRQVFTDTAYGLKHMHVVLHTHMHLSLTELGKSGLIPLKGKKICSFQMRTELPTNTSLPCITLWDHITITLPPPYHGSHHHRHHISGPSHAEHFCLSKPIGILLLPSAGLCSHSRC